MIKIALSILIITLAICSLVITVKISNTLDNISNTVIEWIAIEDTGTSTNSIEELTIESDEVKIHIKGLDTEISNQWLKIISILALGER